MHTLCIRKKKKKKKGMADWKERGGVKQSAAVVGKRETPSSFDSFSPSTFNHCYNRRESFLKEVTMDVYREMLPLESLVCWSRCASTLFYHTAFSCCRQTEIWGHRLSGIVQHEKQAGCAMSVPWSQIWLLNNLSERKSRIRRDCLINSSVECYVMRNT